MENSYFKSLPLPKSLEGKIYFKEGNELTQKPSIENLSRINIFVGPNNSGKSLIARELIKQKFLFKRNPYVIDKEIKMELEARVNDYIKEFNNYDEKIHEFNELKSKFPEKIVDIKTNTELDAHLSTLKEQIVKLGEDNEGNPIAVDVFNNQGKKVSWYENDQKRPYVAQKSLLAKMIRDLLIQERINKEFKKIYIPTIRGLRTIYKKSEFQSGIWREYDFDSRGIKIEMGDDIHEDIFDMRNGKKDKRRLLDEFELFLGKEFFDGEIDLITQGITPQSDNAHRKVVIKIGEEEDREIHNVGDGIQMIITMTFPLFKSEYKQGIIVIEEPELSIHPGMQKKFMQFLIEHPRTQNFQFFICTHSNHILDSINESNEISIFSFEKKKPTETDNQNPDYLPDFIITNLSYGNKTVLDLLGVSNTSVYLSNYSIWVEGMSDKLYIKKYLDVFAQKEGLEKLKEGIDYSFVFSGGSNISHFEFINENKDTEKIIVDTLCGKAIVVVDGDSGKKSKRKETLIEALGIRFIDLGDEEIGATEIENLLTVDIITKVVHSYSKWSNVNQEEIEKSLKASKNNISKTRIGSFIDDALKDLNDGKRTKFADRGKNKTLKSGYKVGFSRKAVMAIEEGCKVSDQALKLAENIYNIISKQK